MSIYLKMIKRNVKLFFKDKGMFFTSLVTPAILLVLYSTFLKNVYYDSFASSFPGEMGLSEKLINGIVGGQIISSILAVSCVTIACCSNFLMVQDKARGVIKDLRISPVSYGALSLVYYISSLISTLIICFTAAVICLIHLLSVGWFMSGLDVFLLFGDVFLLVMFGTALSSIVNFFLKTQGQISAVGTIISSGYGFICGAYMPISSFGESLQRVVMFLPGTYGTALTRNHSLRGAFEEMKSQGVPSDVIEKLKDSIDCNLYFFGNKVDIPIMYLVMAAVTLGLIIIYILLNKIRAH